MRRLLVTGAASVVTAVAVVAAGGLLLDRMDTVRHLAGPVAIDRDGSRPAAEAAAPAPGMGSPDATTGATAAGPAGLPDPPDPPDPPGPAGGPDPHAAASLTRDASGDGAESSVRSARFDFDGGLTGSIVDRSGGLRLRTRTANGGRLETSPRGDGLAVRFPARCRTAAAACPRAILEAQPAGGLSPGRRAVRWGAAVRMSPEDTAAGANVVQQGYSTGGQFKLQVDGTAGRPSCAVVGSGPTGIYLAVADVTVADGRWHTVDCTRDGATLRIAVDGTPRGSVPVPARLSIVSDEPLRIGGKGLRGDNDQFAGTLDDVYVRIDRG
jgi:hypothetical protein